MIDYDREDNRDLFLLRTYVVVCSIIIMVLLLY